MDGVNNSSPEWCSPANPYLSVTSDSSHKIVWRKRGTRYAAHNFQKRHRYGEGMVVWADIIHNGRTSFHIFHRGTVISLQNCREIIINHVRFFSFRFNFRVEWYVKVELLKTTYTKLCNTKISIISSYTYRNITFLKKKYRKGCLLNSNIVLELSDTA